MHTRPLLYVSRALFQTGQIPSQGKWKLGIEVILLQAQKPSWGEGVKKA